MSVTSTSGKDDDETTINFSADGTDGIPFGANDVLMDSDDGKRYIVTAVGNADPLQATSATVCTLDGSAAVANATKTRDFIVLGNIYGQGTEQPSHFMDPDFKKYKTLHDCEGSLRSQRISGN